jgi:hypothetical protein
MSASDYPAGAFEDDKAPFNEGLKNRKRRPRMVVKKYKFKCNGCGTNHHHLQDGMMVTYALQYQLKMIDEKDTKLYCDECGSDDVQIKMWVNPNTSHVDGECSTDVIEDGWCKQCNEHALVKPKSDE